jgi:hypothetical protein
MRVALALVAVVEMGCATIPEHGNAHLSPAGAEGESWDAAWREATRRAQPYEYVTVRAADLRATLVTPRLRKAFLDHRSEFHGQFAKEIAKDLVQMGNADEGVDAPMKAKPDAEEQVIIFVAMYVTNQKERDLAANTTIWDTRLVRGSASVKPIKIETLRMSPAVPEVFPYVDRFDEIYLLRFPLVDTQGRSFLTPGGDPLRLEVRSALADAVVEWELAE